MSDAQVQLTIDGLPVSVPAGTTVFDAARMHGIPIPTLCHQQNETPVGVCRVCVVDVGGRVLAASCVRPAENRMVVSTNSDKVLQARRTLIELLMADHPSPCARQRQSNDCELETLARLEGIHEPRFPKKLSPRGQDNSSLVIAVDHEACILCDRCIRGCDEIRHNDVLGRRGKGFWAGIAFDQNPPMGNSSCVSCGECMVSCPTGALTNKSIVKTVLPGEPVGVDELQQLTYFQKVSGTFLELNRNAVVRRHFKQGEIICREGEYGSTAFYILEGQAQVFLATPLAHSKSDSGASGFFGKLTSRLLGPPAGTPAGRSDARDHPHRCAGGLALRSSRSDFRSGRSVRRDDLHQPLSAFGDRARRHRLRDVRDAAQCARHHPAQQDAEGPARRELPQARARRPSAQRADVRFADAGFHRCAAQQGGAGALHQGRRDLPAGRHRRQFLPDPPGIREGVGAASGRRSGLGLPRPRRLFRRDRPARRGPAHSHLHRARSCRSGSHPCGRVSSDGGAIPRSSPRAWKHWRASVRSRTGNAWPRRRACRSIPFSRKV